MANNGLAVLEEALRSRKLDRTLTSVLPSLERTDPAACVGTQITALDDRLRPSTMAQGAAGEVEGRGGLPRGQLSEISGPRSSGRSTLLTQVMAATTQRGEIVALIDTCDRFDVGSAVSAGVDLDRLLWVRGDAVSSGASISGSPHLCSSPVRVLDRGLKALNLVLQAGGFGLVAIDLADLPVAAITRIPFTTWPRIQRIIEGSDTACVVVGSQPIARSAGGLTLMLTGTTRWTRRRVDGLDVVVRIVSPRQRVQGEVHVCGDSRE
jgi:hypothetical protein